MASANDRRKLRELEATHAAALRSLHSQSHARALAELNLEKEQHKSNLKAINNRHKNILKETTQIHTKRFNIEFNLLKQASMQDVQLVQQSAQTEIELLQRQHRDNLRRVRDETTSRHAQRLRAVIDSEEECRRESQMEIDKLHTRIRENAASRITLYALLGQERRLSSQKDVALSVMSAELSLAESEANNATERLHNQAQAYEETISIVSSEVEEMRARWQRVVNEERARHAEELLTVTQELAEQRAAAEAALVDRDVQANERLHFLNEELKQSREEVKQLERALREESSSLLEELSEI